jgi:microcystin-dependent protein
MAEPFIGEIRMFAGTFAPVGWFLCQGQTLAISDNQTLYALIGTTYGGDGVTTFQLPNLSSRVPVHQTSGYPLGQTGGAESVTLTSQQLPVHSHTALAASTAATTAAPAAAYPAAWQDEQFTPGVGTTAMAPAAISLTGGGLPHDNMAPYLAMNFIIASVGIFPNPQ